MIRPLRAWLAVRPDPEPLTTPAGLHLLPHVDQELTKSIVSGEVVAVGAGPAEGGGMWGLEPGHRVAYSPVMAQEAPDGLLLIKRDSVVGVYQ